MTSLYRKYRPQTFSDVIGQTHIVQTLSNSLRHGRIGHAYLFTGPRGIGKTTLARIFAKAVNCSSLRSEAKADETQPLINPCLECENCKNIAEGKSLDIFEIDAASNTGVDNIRELRENVKFPPTHAKYKVYIIDEVHMLSTGAFNALLKTLEEPPAHVIFILATTELHKVPETIISRCQRYDFSRLSIEQIVGKLSLLAKSEKITVEKDALEMIAVAAEGGMRDAESLLSQVMALEDKKITAKEVEGILGTTRRQSLEKMAGFLLSKDTSGALELVNELSQEGYDLDVFNKSLLNYLRQIMLLSVNEKLAKIFSFELTGEQTKTLLEQAKNHKAEDILFVLRCFAEIQGKIRSSFIPQLPIEMAIIKSLTNTDETQTNTEKAQNMPPGQKLASAAPKSSIEPKNAPISSSIAKSDATPSTKNKPEIKQNDETSKIQEFEQDLKISIQEVKKHWNRAILEIKPLNHSLSAVLQSCRPISIEKGLLSIAAKFPFHKDKLNEQANRLTLESVFANIFEIPLKVVAINDEKAPDSHKQAIPQAEEKPKETSSLLTEAMNLMGGTVVE